MRIAAHIETWSIAGEFRIARGAKTEATVLVVTIEEGGHVGRGESVPYGRYGETPEGEQAAVDLVAADCAGLDREALLHRLPAGAARNALDCALWDLRAKQRGCRAWELLSLDEPPARVTAFTLSVADPVELLARAAENAHRPWLKLKLDGTDDLRRIQAVHRRAPTAALILDANEAWDVPTYRRLVPRLPELGVALIEQPFPASEDEALADLERPVPVCADESFHGDSDPGNLADRYDAVNLKLDKVGGLTAALAMCDRLEELSLRVMIGCMVCTSLAIAPTLLLAHRAHWLDIDGPLLLARDRPDGLVYDGSTVFVPTARLWG